MITEFKEYIDKYFGKVRDVVNRKAVEKLAEMYCYRGEKFEFFAREEIESFFEKQPNYSNSKDCTYLEKINGIEWFINSRIKNGGTYGKVTKEDVFAAYFTFTSNYPKWEKNTGLTFMVHCRKTSTEWTSMFKICINI